MSNGVYTYETVIKTADSTPNKELRLSSIVRFAQEVSVKSIEELGFDSSKTLNKGLLWVIAKQYFVINRIPHYDDHIKVVTYPGKKMANFFLRHYKFLSSNDEVLIRGVAVWCLIDQNNRKMINPSDYGIAVPEIHEEGEIDFPPSYHVDETLPNSSEICATWSKCDINGHLNNTYYFDIIEDLIPIDFLLNHSIKSFNITYKREIPLGTKATINYGFSSPYYDFVGDKFQVRVEFN